MRFRKQHLRISNAKVYIEYFAKKLNNKVLEALDFAAAASSLHHLI